VTCSWPSTAAPTTDTTRPAKPSIAVLPFANMSGDPEQEFFADGLTEDIITALSRISGLWVIARGSPFTYKGRPTGVKQVAHDLGVRYVMEGRVRRAGELLRITARFRVAGQPVVARQVSIQRRLPQRQWKTVDKQLTGSRGGVTFVGLGRRSADWRVRLPAAWDWRTTVTRSARVTVR